jgi:hypothetical protein
MTCQILNLTRRLVSIRGNSGETWHLPPGSSLDLPDAETTENDKIAKLVANGLLSVRTKESAESVSARSSNKDRPRDQRARAAQIK